MTVLASVTLILMLMISLTFTLYYVLASFMQTSAKRARLQHYKALFKHRSIWDNNPIVKHIDDLLKVDQSRLGAITFLMISLFTGLSGILAGVFFFYSVKGVFITGGMGLFVPYLSLRTRLLNKQMQTRMDFLPAVEVFYECYTANPQQNMRHVLQTVIKGERMDEPMRTVFVQLHQRLATDYELENSLRLFNLTLGHRWSHFFSHIFRMGLVEGVDVSENLKELIQDMRAAILANEQERNRLLEIRIANFSPVLFLLLFIGVNYKLNPTQTMNYYLFDPGGKNMLLDAIFLIFLSFLMGVYLSIRRI